MPYTLKNPPDWLKNLPPGAQRIGITVFNSTFQALTGDDAEREEKARVAAWAAIKQKYTRNDAGVWTQREKDIIDPREIVALVGAKTSWFSIELEPNAWSAYDKTAMVNFASSEGIRLEWGFNEGTAEWDLITVWFDDSIYTKLAAEQFIANHKTEMVGEAYKPRKIDGTFFCKFAEDPLMAPQKIIYGEFLIPWYTDSQGHFCSEYEIGKAVHEFMIEYTAGRTRGIGINHVIWGGVGDLVECFQATEDQKMFTPGSGVAAIKCSDPAWAKVQNGELNGLSIGGSWTLIPIIPRVDHSKGIFQLMDIHIKDMSLVIKGAIRKDFTAFKSADGRSALTPDVIAQMKIGKSADQKPLTFLKSVKEGGRRLMDVKAIAKQVLAEFLNVVGRKQDELQPVTPEALGDVGALATQMNLIISRVNANTTAILSAGAASAEAKPAGEGEGLPKEQEKPPGEGKPAGEGEGGGTGGEGGEGEGGGKPAGEGGAEGSAGAGEGKPAGEGDGEGGEGGEAGAGAGASEGEKSIGVQLSVITDLVRGIDHRVQVIETARGITMQDRIRGTKGADGKPGMRYSSMFDGYIPTEEESGAKKE